MNERGPRKALVTPLKGNIMSVNKGQKSLLQEPSSCQDTEEESNELISGAPGNPSEKVAFIGLDLTFTVS